MPNQSTQNNSRESNSDALVRGVRWIALEIRWLGRVLVSSLDRFYWGNGFSRAASLAYTSLLSLFPVTALVFGMLALFAVSQENISNVREFVFRQFVPDTQLVDKILHYMAEFGSVVTNPASSFSLLALGFLLFTSILLINSIEYALNEIWQVFEARSITDRIAIFCAMLLVAPVLAVSAFYFTKLRIEPILGNLGVDRVYSFLLPFLIDFLAFFALNYLVPKAPVKVPSAVFGAFFSALLFGLAKGLFAIYVERFASYDALYGALAAIPIFLIWLYLSWIIVLLGAECAYQAQYLPKAGRIWKRTIMSIGDLQFVLAVQSLIMISRSFANGNRMPNDLDIAERLGCSSTVLKPVLSALEKSGIVTRGSTREMPLALLRAPDTIEIKEISNSLFGPYRGVVHYAKELERLFGACASDSNYSKLTLADIVADPNQDG